MLLLYNIFLLIYAALIHIVAPFYPKAHLFLNGRKGQWQRMQQQLAEKRNGKPIVHFHCASTGEFEQGRPFIEELKRNRNDIQILLTFFSPSGFEACQNYAAADYIFYLPIDFRWNARRFASIIKPVASVFVKYEYWHYHIKFLKKSGTKCYLASAAFRPKQTFFLPIIGRFFRKILRNFNVIFVQDERSFILLQSIGFQNVEISGDTRFDRVADIAMQPKRLPVLEQWAQEREVLVAGSTWSKDEILLAQVANNDTDLRIIFVPHELHEPRIKKLRYQLQKSSILYSQLIENKQININDYHYIIVDCVGLLSSIYRLAHYAYIGGGFGAGIHNTLEAAAYGIPVFFGINYGKFREANDLIAFGGAFSVKNSLHLQNHLYSLRKNKEQWTNCCAICKKYVQQNLGATKKICNSLIINKL
jgi:3-deoxy-D-manno-octulosonic-acid transferase